MINYKCLHRQDYGPGLIDAFELAPVPSIRPANSTLIRNAVEDLLGEDFEGSFESEYLAWAIVESLLDPSQVRIGDGTDWR
ncbi:UNVERIFIED_ORG: hypothetical protein FHR68_003947 [Xanthomonas campestris]